MRSHLKARTRLVLTGAAVIAAVGLLAGCTGSRSRRGQRRRPGHHHRGERRGGRHRRHRLLGPRGRPRLARRHQLRCSGRCRQLRRRRPAGRRGHQRPDRPDRRRRDLRQPTASTRSCCCPTDGAALTEAAIEAMEAGIPVINVDRVFSSPFAARATILGDNYGMGVSAGTYICEQLGDNPDADRRGDRRHRLAAAHAGPLAGLRRRARGLRSGGLGPRGRRLHRRRR